MSIEQIPSSDINRRLKEILEGVSEGKAFVVTRYGKNVATIGPPPNALISTEGTEEEHQQARKMVIEGSPPKSAQNARDELLNRIRSKG